MLTTDEVLIGATPNVPMTNEQRRAHRRLASAEKRYIALLVWEADPEKIARQERVCARLTQSWKRACNG